jgi:hypothetical protein
LNTEREKLLGLNLREVFPKTIGTAFEENFRKAFSENQAVEFETYSNSFDRWINVRAYPWQENQLFVYFHDVTERKRVVSERDELALRDQEASKLREETEQLAQIIQTQQEIIRAAPNMQAVMQLVTEHAQKLTRADGGAVIEIAEDDELIYKAATGQTKPFIGYRVKISSSLSGLCVQTAEF